MAAESPDLTIAMRLLDQAKLQGFTAARVGPGEDALLLLTRQRDGYRDEILINGFTRDCSAARQRHSSLVIVGGGRTV